jgi:hypothetical protein
MAAVVEIIAILERTVITKEALEVSFSLTSYEMFTQENNFGMFARMWPLQMVPV